MVTWQVIITLPLLFPKRKAFETIFAVTIRWGSLTPCLKYRWVARKIISVVGVFERFQVHRVFAVPITLKRTGQLAAKCVRRTIRLSRIFQHQTDAGRMDEIVRRPIRCANVRSFFGYHKLVMVEAGEWDLRLIVGGWDDGTSLKGRDRTSLAEKLRYFKTNGIFRGV